MFGFKKSPAKIGKQGSVDPGFQADSDEGKNTLNPARRTSSEPMLITPDFSNEKKPLEQQSMQELEKYAVNKSEETTKSVNNCLRIAENIRGDATRTLDMLHQQGEQITRTHMAAVDIDKDLSRGEKILNNLGGMFSMPWKPKKTKDISGPDLSLASAPKKADPQQREKLGLGPKGRSAPATPPPEGSGAMQKVEYEKAKQDDGLSDLSNILGDLKGMAMDMGNELDRQNKAIDNLSDDIDEVNSRVKGANQRTRRLLE
ncbi:hypothetical protein ACFX13_011493 [Malus domestica]|uniref:t-SNARE coiled-coil homology domain-containing protein n=2 Tax=Malus TaxID=3749 RepID=A0A498IBH8_MALDO|nr:putative SNAP25 homologous protein SNAP30 [Malus sylvestris]XP_050117288.1 putative SNAP25 homologous protein SNAP30 [Malus sylvestris]XP_050117289.1 putative SNAP25 homologous protein SNAP30 [Malus sylvestris]RXH79484.1 hypothetical protein DVH24_040631 [Malus domestica]